uniref:Uncharacterized protein n=1 Tax=Rhizophora mucronata TaxID=61149 RepID=A0A2P2NRL1_RHIMU
MFIEVQPLHRYLSKFLRRDLSYVLLNTSKSPKLQIRPSHNQIAKYLTADIGESLINGHWETIYFNRLTPNNYNNLQVCQRCQPGNDLKSEFGQN